MDTFDNFLKKLYNLPFNVNEYYGERKEKFATENVNLQWFINC